MSYKVVLATPFKLSLEKLKKRYRPLGVVIPGSSGIRKLRLRNSDTLKGKSGGYRLLYYFTHEPSETIFLLLLYAKSDQADVTKKELETLLDELNKEIEKQEIESESKSDNNL